MNKFEYKNLTPFKWFVLENFPFIEADFDALTDWQLYCKLGKEINKIIDSQNVVGTEMENVTNAFIELKNYVDNYFENLDVQDEINNKLNEMVEAGTLQEIIADYLNSKAIFGFDTINDMKQATNLINGSYAKTLGFYEKNDGGSGLYKIRNITNEDVVDNMFIIAMSNSQLVAELIIENTINVKQLGAYGDGLHDDSLVIQKALSTPYKVEFKRENYLIANTITISPGKIIDFNWATLITTNDVTAFTINKNNGTNIFTYITIKNVFVNMENGGNFIEDINCYNITYDNIRINRLHGSNFGFKITNGFNHRFVNVWINGMSDNSDTHSGNYANGIIYNIDGNTEIKGITNVTNTTFKDCLIQTLYNGIKFERTGNSGSYDTTFIENIGFSKCDKCINIDTHVLSDVNIQTIRCEWSDYALYVGYEATLIINNFFSNGTKKAIYNNGGNIIFGGYVRFDSQNISNTYIIDKNTGRISFKNCINQSNVGMIEFNPDISSEPIIQMDNVKTVSNNTQTIRLNTFRKIHYIQTNYLNFTNISNLLNGMEFMITNARDSGSLTLPDGVSLAVGETVKCNVINNSIKYVKLT